MYVCFLDYNKAFDKIRHGYLVALLEKKNLDKKDIRIINNLYYSQNATVKVENEFWDYREIKRGVRQGYVLSPLLFSLSSEDIKQAA